MAKILVVEDSISDLISRYGHLAKNHEIQVVYHTRNFEDWEDFELLEAERVGTIFDKRVHRTARNLENFEVYFLDGLQGGL